jgi:hypothetical protein
MYRHHRAVLAFALLALLSSSALIAEPARTAAPAGGGLGWSAIWQSFLSPFAALWGAEDGRGIWDPNGGASISTPLSNSETSDGRSIWDPNGLASS